MVAFMNLRPFVGAMETLESRLARCLIASIAGGHKNTFKGKPYGAFTAGARRFMSTAKT